MNDEIKNKIRGLLDEHRIMTVATLRPDGWPQATTVGYVSEDLTLYFLCARDSQKARNLARDARISLTIDHDVAAPLAISGLSMAAHARPVADAPEVNRFFQRLAAKYPEYASLSKPNLDEIRVFRVTPMIISVLDYSKGFGHSDLVTC